MGVPWTEKHRPRRISQVVGNRRAVEKFVSYMKSWEEGKPGKKSVLLHGPPGVGKTSAAIAYATDNGYDLVEVNASDWRNAKKIEEVVGSASQQSTLSGLRKRMILVDEVDGIWGREDAGGLGALGKVITETRVPIVLVANDPWIKRLRSLRQKSELIGFRGVHTASVISYLRKISKAEDIRVGDSVLRAIAEKVRGDLRSAINDLQAVSEGREEVTLEHLNALGERDRTESIFESLSAVFRAGSLDDARRSVDSLDRDIRTFYTWIVDNAPRQLTDASDLFRAMEALARADVYLTRCIKEQRWVNLRYAIPLMTGGVALSRKRASQKYVRFSYPQKMRMMARWRGVRMKRKAVAAKLAAKCHTSAYRASRDVLPFVEIIFKNDQDMASGLIDYFDLSESDVEFLSG